MSSLFDPRPQGDVWFRIGRLQVTSTLVAVLLGLAGMLAWVIVPSLPMLLALIPEATFAGQIWRLVTWPVADTLGIWSLLTLLMLWWFGTSIENSIGRDQMGKLLLGIAAVLTVSTMAVGLLLPGSTGMAGLRMVQFCILLLFIAENPHVKFFFGIPAWVLGAVLLGLEVLQLVAFRQGGSLLALLLSLAGVALLAKRLGLLSSFDWLPGSSRPSRRRAARPTAPPKPTRQERRHTSDEGRLDELLGKISAHGIHSLTKGERAELDKIRERRRR